MGVAILTAALALLLLLHIPGGKAQITCYTTSDCTGSGSSESSHQDCCLQSGTMAYDDSTCKPCVVLGWWQAVQDDGSITMNPSFTAIERTPPYNFDIGYIKGTDNSSSQLRTNEIYGNTSDAADEDDVDFSSSAIFPGPSRKNATVDVRFKVDQLAMESPVEQFTLRLTAAGFGVTDEVVFIQDMTVYIVDNDNVTIQIKERDSTRGENAEPSEFPVAVVRPSIYGARLNSPITFRIVPISYKQVEDDMIPIPSGFELTENVDAPMFATANVDFDSTNITGTFLASNNVRDEIDTPIPFTNDDIDEVDQFFLVKLELVSATNPDRVTIGRTFSQCVIEDEDSLMLSFEFLEHTVNENVTGGSYIIRIKKEPRPDGTQAETEITYIVSIQTSSSGEQREATEEDDFSIGATAMDFGIGEIRRRFLPEEQYLNIPVDITDDNIAEGSESFKLVISPVAGEPQFTPAQSETIVTIVDDDLLRFGFVETEKVVEEGDSFLVQVSLFDVLAHEMLPPNLMIRLHVQTVNGTAEEDDYLPIVGLTPLDNPLLTNPFQNNHRIQNYTIVIKDDDSIEEDETFILTLTDFPGITSDAILRPHLYTVTITDTDTVTIGFERITYDVSEGDGTLSIKVVVLNGTIGIPFITLSVSTTDDSADGSDYSQLNDFQFDMLSDETSFIIDINITDDTLVENIETFTAGLSLVSPLSPQSLSSRIIIDPAVTTVSIIDNDVRIGFEQTVYQTSETMGFVEVCAVVEEGAVLDSIALPVQATNITAEYIIDYTPDSFDFNFSPGDMRVCYNMTIVADGFTEVAESFLLTMTSPFPNVLIGRGTATVNITESLQVVIVRFGQSVYHYNENDGTGRVEVIKNGNITGSLTVQVTISLRSSANIVQSVSISSPISVTFQENENSQFITFNITNDDVALEDIEIHDFALVDPVDPGVTLGSPDQCQVEITDDDTVSVRFGNTMYSYGEDAGLGIVDVVRTGATVRTFTVDVTSVLQSSVNIVQSGNIASSTVSFGTAASETIVITFIITDDDVALEPVEIHDLTLVDPPDTRIEIGDPRECQVDIIDNDEVTLTFEKRRYTTTEEEGSVEVCVEKDKPIIQSFTFTLTTTAGTAQDGPDYVGFTMRTVTFPVGTDKVCVTIDIVNDVETETNVEGEETFTVSIDPSLPPDVTVGNPGVTTVVIGPDPVQVVYVNDTIVGDPLFHVPIKSDNSSLADVGLCYEIHGENDKYFNLVSDTCTSVNAHWTDITSRVNVINVVAIRTVDNDGNCTEITISLMGRSECAAEVNSVSVETSYENAGILMRKSSRFERWKVIVPNCNNVRLEMWISCHANTILDPATNSEIEANMMKFVVQRGLNAGRMAHGLIGQFWNQEVSVQPYSGPVHTSVATPNPHYRITMPNQRSFVAIHHDVNWIWERVNCLYAGNYQGAPIYVVQDPNDPVIAGEYTSYIVPGPFSEQGYVYGLFDETQCST